MEGIGLKRHISVCLVLLSMLLTPSFLPIASALESNGFKWTVVDDPFPSGPSQWVAQNGSLKQLSNIYRTDREYEFYQGTHIIAGSPDWTDYVLSFDMKSADNDGIGAIVRYQDKDNYYRFLMVQDSGNHGPFRHLEKFVNGVRTVLAEDNNGYLPGQVYSIQFKALGNELEVWMDGSKILSAVDETFRSGEIGFLSYASLDMEIVNLKVVDQYGQPLTDALSAQSSQSAQECAQSCNICDTPPCLYCSGHLGDIAPAKSDLIYEVYSPSSISMNPPTANTFTLDTERIITCIATYHRPGYTPGTIGLLSSLGDQIGPWQAEGHPGMDGRPNCVWVAYINQLLEPGTYAIIDSGQSTWSYVPSDCSGSKGICQVYAAGLQETGSEKSVQGPSGQQSSAQGQPSGMENGSMQGGCHTDPATGREICVFPNAMTPIAAVNNSNNNPEKIVQGGCHKDPVTGLMTCIDTSGDLIGNMGTHVTINPGSIWKVKEYGPMGNLDGEWMVREDGRTIDASWSGGSITDIIDIKSIEGDQITLHRHGNNGYYTGTISPDGLSMSGTASWYSSGETWTATRSDALGNIGKPAVVGSTNVTQAPAQSPMQRGSESTPVMVGSDQIKLPARSSLIETSDWGEVPANQVIVMLKNGKGRTDADRLASSLGGRVVGFFDYINLYQIENSGTTEADVKDSVAKAKQDPVVELAFPNQQSYPDGTVQGKECSPLDDPVYTEGGRGKGYEMIGVQRAWDLMRVSGVPLSKVHVGVVDDGLYKGADEFNSKVKIDTSVQGSELQNSLGKVYDKNGKLEHDFTVVGSHGTGIMNIIAANPDNGGITGIASEQLGDKLDTSMINYNAPPYGDNPESAPDPNDPTKVVWTNGKTYTFGDLLAINKSITGGARIISCSWGNRSADPNTAAAYKKFFEKMANDHPDVLFVCSAGNDGKAPDGARTFPGGLALPNMITVGNVMNDGTKAALSNVDNGTSFEVTLAAPGEESVYGFDNKGGIANNWGGTSMATPQVTSTAALLRALNPGLTAAQIKDILAQTARTSVDIDGKNVPAPSKLGAGILAIDQAVFKVINDQRIKMHLDPFKDIESALALARIALAAENDPASPNDWKVTAQILAVGPGGADVILDLQGEGAVSGNKRQHLANSGSLTWDITLKDTATVVVKRLDTNGCSSVYLSGTGESKRRISGCVNTGCSEIENWVMGGCNNKSAPGVSVDLTFTYILPEYAKDTPTSMTTTTDDKGRFHFEVPPGSQYKIFVKGKEYDPKVYTGENSAGSVCININPTKKLVLPAKAA